MTGVDERFTDLGYEDFRRLAADESLSQYERIGFPDAYREGTEDAIFADIVSKLPALSEEGRTVVDIGPGASDLSRMIQDRCSRNGSALVLIDSPEMLARLPDAPGVEKVEGPFPDCPGVFERYAGRADAVIAYSVLHHAFVDGNGPAFLGRAIELLSHGGSMLLGDIPNVTKRERFLSSPAGREFHRRFTGSDDPPPLEALASGPIDDAVVLDLLRVARRTGCDAYVMPQPEDLPMANRREDILIRRP